MSSTRDIIALITRGWMLIRVLNTSRPSNMIATTNNVDHVPLIISIFYALMSSGISKSHFQAYFHMSNLHEKPCTISHGSQISPTERIHMAPMLRIRYKANVPQICGWIIPPSSHKINWETLMLMSTLVYFCLSKFELQGILIVLTSKLHGFHKSLGLQLFWETKIGEQFTDLLSYLFWPLWKSVYHTLQEKYISASMCKTYWDPFTLFCRSSKSDTYRYLSGIWQDLHLRMDIKEGYLMMSIEIGLSAQNISNTTLDSIVKTIGRVYMISFKE